MVAVLLTVLKIIGISVLAIIGIALFILLALLFVPARYRAGGNYLGIGDYKADIRAVWFLHIASLYADYVHGHPDEIRRRGGKRRHLRIKMLGIVVYDNLGTGSKKNRNKKRKQTKTKQENAGEIQAASVEEESLEYGPVRTDDDAQNTYGSAGKMQAALDEKESLEYGPAKIGDEGTDECLFDIKAVEEKPRFNIFQKIKEIFIEIVNIFKNIKFTFKEICDKIFGIKDNIKDYLKIWRLDSTQTAVAVCKEQLGRVWKEIRPKKSRLDFHLGFDDPALTGEALALWGMLYPVHLGNIDIRPEFDRNVFEGSFAIKGSFRMYVLIKAAVILYRDKNLRILMRTVTRVKNKRI